MHGCYTLFSPSWLNAASPNFDAVLDWIALKPSGALLKLETPNVTAVFTDCFMKFRAGFIKRRFRGYRNLTFLQIKIKFHAGRTVKKRVGRNKLHNLDIFKHFFFFYMAYFPTFSFFLATERRQWKSSLLERRNNFDGEFIDSPFEKPT